ncbi:hypothetical protein BH24CHL6_BH24CHL6_04130 [soil metagenome]
MSDVAVQCQPAGDGWACTVTVAEGGRSTSHAVTVSRPELRRLVGEGDDPTQLVKASFDYMLEREPKESILRNFAVSEIERYFPGYPTEIRARL